VLRRAGRGEGGVHGAAEALCNLLVHMHHLLLRCGQEMFYCGAGKQDGEHAALRPVVLLRRDVEGSQPQHGGQLFPRPKGGLQVVRPIRIEMQHVPTRQVTEQKAPMRGAIRKARVVLHGHTQSGDGSERGGAPQVRLAATSSSSSISTCTS
jgi:hypothetical protein